MKRLIQAMILLSGWVCCGYAADEPQDDFAAGHSKHGEAFNEGPRQQAYLMPGTGPIKFEVSSDVENVQAYIEQGIGQLHGFWYFEAERSFRQAAMLDPKCAIAYWGMAFANANNDDRAKEFIQEAMDRQEHASPREKKYIEAFHRYITSDEKRKKREANFVEDLEAIVEEFPDDLEAKAFLGYALYKYRGSADREFAEVDVVLDRVLAKEKNHPVHHYRIHLWDYKSPQRALDSAAKCGPAAPGIAHMWHMCGHIFSRVKRYDDASWFQEASARVDHRHMMHHFVLPDQIHNFAHNNEWLIRNLMNVGRVQDALELAKNMIELPRHPKYNMLDERKSAAYGRDRLIDVLDRFELWDDAISLASTPYLEPTDERDEQSKRLKLLGEAFARTGRPEQARETLDAMELLIEELKADAPNKDEVRKQLVEEQRKEELEASSAPQDGAKTDSETKDGAETKEAGKTEESKKSKEKTDDQDAANEESNSGVDEEETTVANGNEDTTSVASTDSPSSDAKEADSGNEDTLQDKESDLDDSKESKSEESKSEESKSQDAELGKLDKEFEKKLRKQWKKKKDAHERDVKRLEKDAAHVRGYIAVAEGDLAKGLEELKDAGTDKLSQAYLRVQLGEHEKAVEDATAYAKDRRRQVQPLAGLVEICWKAGELDQARDAFVRLRAVSNRIDMASPVFERLKPIAAELGYGDDFRVDVPTPEEFSKLPDLETLGPFRWQPAPAPDWVLPNSKGEQLSLRKYRGRPVVVVFYLGYGCLHCAEQLQALAPQAAEFAKQGIDLIAISTDGVIDLEKSHETYGDVFPFPLVADPQMEVFKRYRVYDDFEDTPLHGTFLIDGDGRIRWQDISYDPFMDIDFLLKESKRLLRQNTRDTPQDQDSGQLATISSP